MKANLLVTHEPSHLGSAEKEVLGLLKEIKYPGKIVKSNISGLMNIQVKNPKNAVKKLQLLAKKKPNKFMQTYKWIPVDKWSKTNINAMQRTVKNLARNIKKNEKWKMDLGKRKTNLHERDLILKLTDQINRSNIDLSNPDKIIKVEIIGSNTALALLKKDEYLNVTRFKKD